LLRRKSLLLLEVVGCSPRNYKELSPNIWSRECFEERADGLYVKDWLVSKKD